MNDTRGLFTQTVARPDPNHSFPPFPSHHQALLERISDGVLADDRRSAAHELRDLVQESRVAQFAIRGHRLAHFDHLAHGGAK